MSSTLIVNSQEVLNESFDTDLSLPSGWTNESTGTSQTELWTFTDNQDFLWEVGALYNLNFVKFCQLL